MPKPEKTEKPLVPFLSFDAAAEELGRPYTFMVEVSGKKFRVEARTLTTEELDRATAKAEMRKVPAALPPSLAALPRGAAGKEAAEAAMKEEEARRQRESELMYQAVILRAALVNPALKSATDEDAFVEVNEMNPGLRVALYGGVMKRINNEVALVDFFTDPGSESSSS